MLNAKIFDSNPEMSTYESKHSDLKSKKNEEQDHHRQQIPVVAYLVESVF
jgi:hypothetical protein